MTDGTRPERAQPTRRSRLFAGWEVVSSWPLVVASAGFIVAYSCQVIADLPFPARGWTVGVIAITWLVFVVDYLTRLMPADRRYAWFRAHILDLLIVLLRR